MATFKTIGQQEESLLVDKGSKFIGYCFEVANEQEVKNELIALNLIHPKATHHCYAYRLGLDMYNYRANDDGEPSGSAGKPILGQIDSFELTYTLVVVVRYYGGTNLGVSGLISAYKNSAKLCLEKAGSSTKEVLKKVSVTCGYNEVNDLMNYLKKIEVKNWEQDYSEQCKIDFTATQNQIELLTSFANPESYKVHIEED